MTDEVDEEGCITTEQLQRLANQGRWLPAGFKIGVITMEQVGIRWRIRYATATADALGKAHSRWRYDEERRTPPSADHRGDTIEWQPIYVQEVQ